MNTEKEIMITPKELESLRRRYNQPIRNKFVPIEEFNSRRIEENYVIINGRKIIIGEIEQ